MLKDELLFESRILNLEWTLMDLLGFRAFPFLQWNQTKMLYQQFLKLYLLKPNWILNGCFVVVVVHVVVFFLFHFFIWGWVFFFVFFGFLVFFCFLFKPMQHIHTWFISFHSYSYYTFVKTTIVETSWVLKYRLKENCR